MTRVTLILKPVIVGTAMWAVNTCISMARPISNSLSVVGIDIVRLWRLQTSGMTGRIRGIRVK